MAVANDVRKNFNLVIDGKGYAGNAEEVNFPEIALKTEELRAAGMDGTIDVTMGLEKMTMDFTLTTHARDVMALFGVREGKQAALTIYSVLESYDGTVKQVKHNVRGKITKMSQGAAKSGEIAKDKYEMTLDYYKHEIAGKVVHEIDVINSVCIIDGADVLADVRSALAL